jgi:hypothetical protein
MIKKLRFLPKDLSMNILFLLFSFVLVRPLQASSYLNLEMGAVSNPYNQIRIPGDTGTRFNMADAFNERYFFYQRLTYKRDLGSKHGLRLLYAPLKLTGELNSDQTISFQGTNFTPGRIGATYQFNSYRGSYYYRLRDEERWKLQLGVTAKIRDAAVTLSQNVTRSRTDLGVVPLLYLWTEYRWNNGLRVVLDIDGLAAPQGRALDGALMAGYLLTDNVAFNLGFRMLEGGVDNDKVYNFSQLNYFFLSTDIFF